MTETENRHTLLQLNSLHLPKLEAQLLPPQFSICFSVFHYNSLFKKKKKKVQQASKKGFTSMTMASTNIGLKSHGRGLMSHGRGLKSHGRGLRLGRAEARKQTIFQDSLHSPPTSTFPLAHCPSHPITYLSETFGQVQGGATSSLEEGRRWEREQGVRLKLQ